MTVSLILLLNTKRKEKGGEGWMHIMVKMGMRDAKEDDGGRVSQVNPLLLLALGLESRNCPFISSLDFIMSLTNCSVVTHYLQLAFPNFKFFLLGNSLLFS